jgi:hypothetical protein
MAEQKRVDLRLEREGFALGGLLDHIDGRERHFFHLVSPGRTGCPRGFCQKPSLFPSPIAIP